MKLFTRYSRINVVATIIIFLISSVAYFFVLKYVLVSQIDEDLKIEQKEVQVYVQKHGRLPDSLSMEDQMIRFSEVDQHVGRSFSTTYITDGDGREKFRQLFFGIQVGDRLYRVEVDKSLEKTESIIHSILMVTLVTILLIMAVSFVINRFVLKTIWKPFYKSLDTMKAFQVSKADALKLAPTAISEFQFMNDILERTTGQARAEYVALKTFSENASHEIQTPIAIVRSKLDLLLQEEGLSEKQGQVLQAAYDSIQKLTRLTRSLLTLAKIENHQFPEKKRIDFATLLRRKIDEFSDLWAAQKISVHHSLQPFHCDMNGELAELMINNLLSNATRHNYPGGEVWIECGDGSFRISNTSTDEPMDETQLYSRFYRPNPEKDGTGLGLSIVRLICETSDLEIRYETKAGAHLFTVRCK